LSATELRPLLIGLPPVIADGSRVLILGSFPSEMSLEKHEYYGNPQNHFWPIMESLFGIDRSAPYGERTARLLAQGVAVWDVIAECAREGSGDDRIQQEVANPLVDLLAEHERIGHVAFNGGTAFTTARVMTPEIFSMPEIHCERLPSTSPRNARMRLVDKVEAWARIGVWLTDAS
jgi:double-stranded uracil-DNA glycosylase